MRAENQTQTFSKLAKWKKAWDTKALHALIANPDSYMEKGQYLKNGPGDTTTVAKINIDGCDLVIKRYNMKGGWHTIKRAFTPSRAMRCWHYANRLIELGISTPEPVAMIEKRWGWLRSTAYFATTYAEGELATGYLPKLSEQKKKQLIGKFGGLFEQLKMNKIAHGDMKSDNFIIRNSEIFVIDLDAMHQYRCGCSFHRAHQRDKKRFLANWKEASLLSLLNQ